MFIVTRDWQMLKPDCYLIMAHRVILLLASLSWISCQVKLVQRLIYFCGRRCLTPQIYDGLAFKRLRVPSCSLSHDDVKFGADGTRQHSGVPRRLLLSSFQTSFNPDLRVYPTALLT
ncbi:hypothetical protein M422DRAFT_277100 [Sphaerobolus stellatus SS14]|uniref:Uncharacterized protein n=1 Tax=Sphaerobolus stellatus (strain SS14) TaxID=990650 RepID=A0A0C9T159_SPHS4|nr:hypothetical protein M422DRAFT_277100 [Sphaerobolus stellatus SS14]